MVKGRGWGGAGVKKRGKGIRKRFLTDVQRDTLHQLKVGKILSRKAQDKSIRLCEISLVMAIERPTEGKSQHIGDYKSSPKPSAESKLLTGGRPMEEESKNVGDASCYSSVSPTPLVPSKLLAEEGPMEKESKNIGDEPSRSSSSSSSPPLPPIHSKSLTGEKIEDKSSRTASSLPSSPSLSPSMPSNEPKPLCQFDVVDEDCCDVAFRFVKEKMGKVGLLIHGSGENPGGGYKRGARGQEEAICRRSNLVACVEGAKYPLPEFGSLYIPALYLLRAGPDMNFEFYKRPVRVSAVVAHCYCHMRTADPEGERLEPKYEEKTFKKIINMLSTFAAKGNTHLVLGAWGCEAGGNPPEAISALFQRAFNPDKYPFAKFFKRVTFAISLNRRCFEAFQLAFSSPRSLLDNDQDFEGDSDKDDSIAEATISPATSNMQMTPKGTLLPTSANNGVDGKSAKSKLLHQISAEN
mmetsp:Transcript_23134/g.37269  ORF Transcript_23134/g.37269 Transcript_23134/m.37269 type:complete len:466 (+) Transcript_23134:37-1434(+)